MAKTSKPKPAAVPKRHVVIPRKLKWRHHIAAFLIFAGMRLISWTWRFRIVDKHDVLHEQLGPVIFCVWHNRLALSMRIWERFGRSNFQCSGLVGLISASHDGGLLARVLRFFNVEAVRGSSSRRGPQALLELTSWTDRGYAIAITPDGPRGPRYKISDGIIALAQLSGLSVIPVSAYIRPKVQLRSWDKFQIPWPLARCDVRVGPLLRVPREAGDAEREELKRQLQERMDAMTED